MKLAILGTRGIPANYGGFETFAEELSVRLVARGHKVTVYCRSNNIQFDGRNYKGVDLAVLPTIGTKYFDTVFVLSFPCSMRLARIRRHSHLQCRECASPGIPAFSSRRSH
jgi:hypothetical protein